MANTANPPAMEDDPIGYFCAVTGECREAALFYLECFQWNPEDAIKGFQGNFLPPHLSIEDDETELHFGLKRPFPAEVPPEPPRPLRSPWLSNFGEGSFRFQVDFESLGSSEMAEVDETNGMNLLMGPANASSLTESSEGDVVDQPSRLED